MTTTKPDQLDQKFAHYGNFTVSSPGAEARITKMRESLTPGESTGTLLLHGYLRRARFEGQNEMNGFDVFTIWSDDTKQWGNSVEHSVGYFFPDPGTNA